MRPLTFNPGPSKISSDTYQDLAAFAESGFLECSHRSQNFYTVSAECLSKLKTYLNVPAEYTIIFLDSATAAWHSIVANAVADKSFHLVNGAFSKKAAIAASELYKQIDLYEVPLGSAYNIDAVTVSPDTELISACYNESSTGVMMTPPEVIKLRERFPEPLLAIDATSAAAAVSLPIAAADLWYFSVQKGFGLPAGLGVLIISPRALEKSRSLEKTKQNLAGLWQWSNYVAALEKQAGRTIQTPNMLNIYLLNQKLKRYVEAGGLTEIEKSTTAKAERIWDMIATNPNLDHFVTDRDHRSRTVIAISAKANYIKKLHQKAAESNLVLGNGYGELKETTFRLANFPAITNEDIETLSLCIKK